MAQGLATASAGAGSPVLGRGDEMIGSRAEIRFRAASSAGTPTSAFPAAALNLRLDFDPAVTVPIGSWSLATALGVILFAILVGRPRRWESKPGWPPPLADRPIADALPTPGLIPPSTPAVPAVVASGSPPTTRHAPEPAEANMPRWLRPTLREQRRSGDRH